MKTFFATHSSPLSSPRPSLFISLDLSKNKEAIFFHYIFLKQRVDYNYMYRQVGEDAFCFSFKFIGPKYSTFHSWCDYTQRWKTEMNLRYNEDDFSFRESNFFL